MNFYKNIVDEVNTFGISKTHVNDLFDDRGMELFNEVIDYYDNFISAPRIIDRCNRIASGNPIHDKNKWFEITHYEFLNRPLNLDDSIVKLYMQDVFIDIAELFYGELPRVRNIITWIHPQNANQTEIASQRWHRDQEDYKIFKVFINLSDITSENGPTQYCKKTHYDGEFGSVYPQTYYENKPGGEFYPSKHNLEVCDISGPRGTIHFINTNGMHKGGLVKSGMRCLTQANFLRPSAPAITQTKVLKTFDCYPKIGNYADVNSDTYKSLSNRQLHLIS